jgi:hypothetical protein
MAEPVTVEDHADGTLADAGAGFVPLLQGLAETASESETTDSESDVSTTTEATVDSSDSQASDAANFSIPELMDELAEGIPAPGLAWGSVALWGLVEGMMEVEDEDEDGYDLDAQPRKRRCRVLPPGAPYWYRDGPDAGFGPIWRSG